MRPSLAFIGAGRVATALALRFYEIGYPITGIYSRTFASAEKLARQIHSTGLNTYPQADIVFLTVPDDEITSAAKQFSEVSHTKAVVHVSGVHDSDILRMLHKVSIGSFHPLYPFREGTRLTGREEMLVVIEASEEWLEVALVDMARAIGGKPAVLKTGQKALYHAAAAIASNYLVTLFDVSLTLMKQAGVPMDLARESLYQLMQGNLDNLRQLAPADALTGPLARGDISTIRRHLAALAETPYERLYRELAHHTIEIASALTSEQQRDLLYLITSREN